MFVYFSLSKTAGLFLNPESLLCKSIKKCRQYIFTFIPFTDAEVFLDSTRAESIMQKYKKMRAVYLHLYSFY
jgi:hypothetical protein